MNEALDSNPKLVRLAIVWLAGLLVSATGAIHAAAIPFGPQQVISTTEGFGISVLAGDLDRDGDLDLVGIGGTNPPSGVYWYANLDGAGEFSTARVIDSSAGQLGGPVAIRLNDMDQDGDLDLLSGTFSQCVWYANDGQGNFGTRTVVRDSWGFVDFEAADLDGDGDLDVIGTVGYDANALSWFRNNGGGTFNPATESFIDSLPNGVGEGRAIAADMDADGDSDLVVLQSTSGDQVAWYRNTNGAGAFSAKQTISTIPTELGDINVADIDRDGDLDVVSVEYGGQTVRWHQNTAGDGSAWTHHTISSTGTTSFHVEIADMDLDGDSDVILASRVTNEAKWIENTAGDGSAWTTRVIGGNVNWPLATIAADVDGDGDPDIVTASLDDTKFAWNENRTIHRNAVFPEATTIGSGAFFGSSVVAADVDGDGDMDALSAYCCANEIAWYENDGAALPSFTGRAISTAASSASIVVAADLDGDGDVDALSATSDDGKIAWHENDGATPPSWTSRTIHMAGVGAVGIFAADLDGDGDVDALSAGIITDEILWYENNGATPPVWTPRGISANADDAVSVSAADVDGDGDMDVLSASSGDDKIAWYESNGASPPLFTERTISTAADYASWVTTADVDRDGDLDVLSASALDGKIAWYENDGASPPGWTERTISTNAGDAYGVVAADLDGDGDIDALSASVNDHKLAWYESNGASPPVWTEREINTSTDGGFAVFAADMDGDGDLDALSGDPRISWYPNRGGQYGFNGADASTGIAYDGESAPMLAIGLQVHARPGDSVGRLASMAVRFDSPTGLLDAPLNSAQANALFDELRIYRDGGNGTFEASADILVATVGTLSLTAGVQTVTFPANDPNVRVAAPATFFVVGLMAPAASGQLVNEFYATHLPASAVVVDASAGLTLSAAAADDVATLSSLARPRFVVDSFSDEGDSNPGDLQCSTFLGECTLRAAIQEANAHSGVDRIALPAGTFTLGLNGTDEDAAAVGDLDVTDFTGSLTIAGQGTAQTIISGGSVDRVLHLLPGVALVLEDLTVTDGIVSGAGVRGAGLLAEDFSELTIRRCAFRGNTSLGSGGAALATGSNSVASIESSVIHGNGGFDGGTTIHNGGSMTIASCTISGNTGTSIVSVAVESYGTLSVTNSTITGNDGGLRSEAASITVGSSIVAGNPSVDLVGDDITTGAFTSAGYNFIGESGSAAFVHGVNGDQVGNSGSPLDPELNPLGAYGGPTLTHSPIPQSPVVDAGRCLGVTVDQRGVKRPNDVGAVANASDGCDVGSYELESGAALPRLELPIRWCGLRGSPSIEDPSLMGASNVNDLLRRRHEAASEHIYLPQTGILFRSAANFIVENYPLLEDPDCVEGPPGTFTCAHGDRGDVYIDPDVANFDEYEELIAACRAAWQAQDPTIEGVTAVQINQFVDTAGNPLSILGIGGRAKEGDAREQAEAGRVAVVDHFYRQNVPGNPNPPNPSDTIDRLLAHELGHAVSLRHGDGIDNDGNGSIDDNDEAAVGLPRFDGNNIMQYRSGSDLTEGQATQARSHMLATVPDVRVQPLADGLPNALPIDPKNLRILDFGLDGVLNLANLRILDFRNLGLLDFEQDGVNDFANLRILDFKNLGILDFKNLRILDFGMGYDNETPAGSTSLHATTAAIPWPPSVRPRTKYFFYLDVDRDDATGAYPAFKVNPSDAPNHFPGSDNFVNNPNVAQEAGVDLIAQVELELTCTGNECSSTSEVLIFDYDDGTGQYVQVAAGPSPAISTVSAGLYVDNGGAPVDLDSAPTGITIQPVIPNSLLFAAGWGFTTPGGGAPPVPNPVRMEVVSTVDCVGNVLNDGSAADVRNCQCTSCASCPDYPGCAGAVGIPQTLAGTTILMDDTGGELTFQPPVLPACTVIPALAAQGQAVTVYVTQLPTDLSGMVEIARGTTVLGTESTGSISAAGSVSVAATLPETALGLVTVSAGITEYAPRAQCLVTVTPTVDCADADADGACDSVDTDDDGDGIPDGGDANPLNRLACRDVDEDGCDDCAGGVDAPSMDGPDYDHDGLCDRGDPDDDDDGVLDESDGQPRNGNACGDLDADQCDDCVIAATPSPENDGPDVEGDGLCDFGDDDDDDDGQSDWADCAPLDGTLRASPSEVSGVRFGSGGVKHRLIWTAPQTQGGSATVSDVVRGNALPVGGGAETCLTSGTGAAQFDDAANPGAGTASWYLVRARNACGTGGYGNRSSGAPRASSTCP